jgi:hypothetical protein
MRAISALLLIVILTVLAGCRDEPTAPPRATAEEAPAQPTPEEQAIGDALAARAAPPEFDPRVVTDTTPVDAQVVDVQMANAGDGKQLTGRRTTTFAKDDPVHLAIRTQGTAPKYTLSAKWLDPAGALLTEYGQDIRAAGPAETQFSLSRPEGWPTGSYRVELAINGHPARTVEFEVR